MTQEEWIERLEERIRVLEDLTEHISDPEDRKIDEYIRRVLKAMITFAWLVRHLTIFAGAIIATKMALDTFISWWTK